MQIIEIVLECVNLCAAMPQLIIGITNCCTSSMDILVGSVGAVMPLLGPSLGGTI